MRVQTGIPGRTRQTLIVSERYMLIGPWVFVPLGQAVIDDVHVVLPLANADQVVVRLDISMKETTRVNVLDPLNQLVGQHEHRVQRKLAMTVVEQIFKTWP